MKLHALLAFYKGRAFWQKQLHRMHAHFGRIYRVTVTYQWPDGEPDPVVTYQRTYTPPELGAKTSRGYVVAWDVTVLI